MLQAKAAPYNAGRQYRMEQTIYINVHILYRTKTIIWQYLSWYRFVKK